MYHGFDIRISVNDIGFTYLFFIYFISFHEYDMFIAKLAEIGGFVSILDILDRIMFFRIKVRV